MGSYRGFVQVGFDPGIVAKTTVLLFLDEGGRGFLAESSAKRMRGPSAIRGNFCVRIGEHFVEATVNDLANPLGTAPALLTGNGIAKGRQFAVLNGLTLDAGKRDWKDGSARLRRAPSRDALN